ncbi:HepT-like ribonuclease domain-containing protein [Deinococcus knuensis]|uniref:Polymerase nucleotidyl transferase domain-containing protein n=1 Tax=Deinococcus knuensis TaxID=1837380 RepID=A0ABQ2SQZ5_9DEIO|nr:HepT-like ribonuclease domain-containing protein [Deinococcus knuensis]GGS34812.1 hypothetical protein GCM10008961_28120 [Deinococcus knuensis]
MNAAQPLFPDVRLETVAARLRAAQAQWEALGVTRVQVFGSVARGEAGEASDIDLLIDFAPGVPRGLLDLMRAREVFERALSRRVDVVTGAALRDPLRREILADAIDVLSVPEHLPHSHREKRWRWRVFDLLRAIDRITHFTDGLTLSDFERNELVHEAVLHGLARLGETTKFIPQSVQDTNPHVPWALLRDVRNLVSHDYFGIEAALIWHTARVELPALRPALQALADGLDRHEERAD